MLNGPRVRSCVREVRAQSVSTVATISHNTDQHDVQGSGIPAFEGKRCVEWALVHGRDRARARPCKSSGAEEYSANLGRW